MKASARNYLRYVRSQGTKALDVMMQEIHETTAIRNTVEQFHLSVFNMEVEDRKPLRARKLFRLDELSVGFEFAEPVDHR